LENHVQIPLANGRLWAKTLVPEPASTNRPWLVFLHEALGCIRLWRDVPERLVAATGLPALVYERFGSGRSDPLPKKRTPGFLHEEAYEVLPEVLHHCGIESCILVGHSDGATIALLHAGRFPETVAGVVSEAAHVFVEPETLAGIRETRTAYLQTNLGEKLAKYHGDKTDALFWAWQNIWLDPEFRSWNIEAELEEIEAPAFVIQGCEDAYGTKAQVEAIAARVKGPCRSWMVPDCGHEPHRQAKERVIPRIAAFIREL